MNATNSRPVTGALGALATFAALLLASGDLAAQRDVQARVTAKGTPLPGVTVTLRLRGGDTRLQARTDSAGAAAFVAVPLGTYDATTEALGFQPASKTIVIDERAALMLTFDLQPAPLPLGSVTVKGEGRVPGLGRTGFYERKLKERGRGNESGGGCGPMVYVNGVVAHLGGTTNSPPALIDQLASIDDVAGIEVYRSASRIPAGYGGAMSAYGVILIWLRTGG